MGALLLDRRVLPKRGALTLSAGVITDVTRLAGVEGDGRAYPDSSVGLWPAATNIATQSIPGALATTGVTKAGDAAATLTKVADSTHPFPNATAYVWCLDNSAGAGDATVDFDGNATASAHTASIYAYKTAGTPNLSIEGASPTAISGATWARYTNTKTATAGDNLRITAPAGAVVYFVAAQFEAGSIATPYIETDGGPASRVAGTVTAPRQFLNPAGGGMAIRYRAGMAYTGGISGATRIRLLNAVNGNNWMILYYDYGTDKWLLGRDNGSGTGETVLSGVQSFALGDTLTIIAEWSASQLSIQIDDAAAVTAASTKAPLEANLPTTFGFGSAAEPPWGNLLWAYGWEGVLSTADRALLVALGDNDPLPHQLRGGATPSFLAPFNGDGTAYRYAA